MSPTTNYDKYQSSNPVVRALIERFLGRVEAQVLEWRPKRIVDLGCGEGIVAGRLRALPIELDYLGVDRHGPSVEVARRENPDLTFETLDFVREPPRADWADLALCLEVLEHLADPESALQRVLAWTRRYALVSVPWEPFFRLGNLARGQHLEHWGNHPEHVQQFGPRSLRRLLEAVSSRVRVETSFPWLIGLVEKVDS